MPREVRMFTREEFERLVGGCDDPGTRDLLLLLRESGCRVREMLSLRKRDVEFGDGRALLHIGMHKGASKTGPRSLALFATAPILKARAESLGDDGRLFPHCYLAYYKRLRALTERLGIVKGERCRVMFHGIRHLALTRDLAGGLTESLAKKKYGWSDGSNIIRTYNHLQCEDLIDFEERRRGGGKPCGASCMWAFGAN